MKLVKKVQRCARAKVAWLLPACVLAASNAMGEEVTRVAVIERWSTVFSGRSVTCHVSVDVSAGARGRLLWHLATNGGVIQRGESGVIAMPARPARVAVSLKIPEIREGVSLRAVLTASFVPDGASAPAASVAKTFWVFGEDPFVHRKRWLSDLRLSLFDPEERTAAVLQQAAIPFTRVAQVDVLPEQQGIVLVGEGVSLRDYRALPSHLLRAAESGATVLCLAPTEGEFGLTGSVAVGETSRPDGMAFRGHDIIHELDKRLDATAWPPDGVIAVGGLKLVGRRGPVVLEVVDGNEGWPWGRLDYQNGGTLIITGFPVIAKWQDGPTPRYLFARLLEVLADEAGSERRRDE